MLTSDLWDRIKIGKEDECWEWQGSTSGCNYGQLMRNSKMTKPHREVWIEKNGPIPKGLIIMHSCDNPICCNPSHLSLGTHQDNSDDKFNKGRANFKSGEDHYKATLSDLEVFEIRSMKGTCTAKEIAELYGVARVTITNILNGRRRNSAYSK